MCFDLIFLVPRNESLTVGLKVKPTQTIVGANGLTLEKPAKVYAVSVKIAGDTKVINTRTTKG